MTAKIVGEHGTVLVADTELQLIGVDPAQEGGDRTVVAEIAPAREAEEIVNDEPKLLESFEVGDVSHHGDLIVVRIARLPKGSKERANRQLADGNTPGSRHVLERGQVFDADKKTLRALILKATGCDVDERFIGPAFVSPPDPTADDLTHVEHGNQGFPAGAVCVVVHQRVWTPQPRALQGGWIESSRNRFHKAADGKSVEEQAAWIDKQVDRPRVWRDATEGMSAAEKVAFFLTPEGQSVAD